MLALTALPPHRQSRANIYSFSQFTGWLVGVSGCIIGHRKKKKKRLEFDPGLKLIFDSSYGCPGTNTWSAEKLEWIIISQPSRTYILEHKSGRLVHWLEKNFTFIVLASLECNLWVLQGVLSNIKMGKSGINPEWRESRLNQSEVSWIKKYNWLLFEGKWVKLCSCGISLLKNGKP